MQIFVMILLVIAMLLLVSALGKQKRRLDEAEEKLESLINIFKPAVESVSLAEQPTPVAPTTAEVKEETENV